MTATTDLNAKIATSLYALQAYIAENQDTQDITLATLTDKGFDDTKINGYIQKGEIFVKNGFYFMRTRKITNYPSYKKELIIDPRPMGTCGDDIKCRVISPRNQGNCVVWLNKSTLEPSRNRN